MTEKEKLLKLKDQLTGYASIDKPHELGMGYFKKNPIIPNMSIYNALRLMSIPYRNESAIDCLNLEKSFNELLDDSKTVSRFYKELGIKKNDIIAVSMPNFYQAVVSYFAANRIGATTTFLNSASEKDEIKHYLNYFESPLFINFNKDRKYNEDIMRNTHTKNIITLDEKDLNENNFNEEVNHLIGYDDLISYRDLKVISKYYKKPVFTYYGGKENSLILFTSGSTGNPKSVVLTNENILASGIYMKNSTNLSNTNGEKSLVCVPFTYPYGFATSTLMSLLCGREAILAPNLSSDNINYFLDKNPNIIFGSPALLELIKRNTIDDKNLSSISTFISGGDFLTSSKVDDGKKFFLNHGADVKICNGSGNAETVGASTNSVGIPNKDGTVGKILTGTTAIIINPDTSEELRYGEEGLYCVSGKNVYKEYYKEPELTRESKFIYNGKEYFKTGTIGKIDDDGYFNLTGRDSRYYIMSTLNKIYCDHVQSLVSAIDVIDSCAVVEKPSDDLLYVNKAFIVLKNGIKPSNDVLEYIKEKCTDELQISNTGETMQLKPYEIPSSFEFVDELPRTKADKIDYSTLKLLAENEYIQESKNETKHSKILRK